MTMLVLAFSLAILSFLCLVSLLHAWCSGARGAHRESNRVRHFNSELTESGLKKEWRDMLPVLVFKESFFVQDTLCSVCLGEYKSEERLRQLPACGHTFHVICIDLWLSSHTSCPLCRFSVVQSNRDSAKPQAEEAADAPTSVAESNGSSSILFNPQAQVAQ